MFHLKGADGAGAMLRGKRQEQGKGIPIGLGGMSACPFYTAEVLVEELEEAFIEIHSSS
jgi:hypothetical protein